MHESRGAKSMLTIFKPVKEEKLMKFNPLDYARKPLCTAILGSVVAVSYATVVSADTAVNPVANPQSLMLAASCNPCNPCNPCAATCNPCNPCAATCNPCNPCAATCNPCNPCAAKCNPCNPCSSSSRSLGNPYAAARGTGEKRLA